MEFPSEREPETQTSVESIAAAFEAALVRAETFVGATAPNPPVGCTILDAQGQVLACEAHARPGTLHAEALAIGRCRDAGLTQRIHTIVVTLEPCNHHGRTPPCTEAILATPARCVWIGAGDPNPLVDGRGVERLISAGLVLRKLPELAHPKAAKLSRDCLRLIAPFAKRTLKGLPWVTIKQALDASGSMIPPSGSKTFTSTASLEFAHRLRRRADAILTGSGTILADSPEFTVRRVTDHEDKHRWLVILDRRGLTPADYIAAARARGFEVRQERDLLKALRALGEAGAMEVLVEAGPTLLTSVLASGLWDERVVITRSASLHEADDVRTIYAAGVEQAGTA